MVRVSDKKVKEKLFLNISSALVGHITQLKTDKETEKFVAELFTKAERIVFAKRFAIVFMLAYGYTYRAIRENLKVSQRTIARLEKQRDHGDFDFLLRRVRMRRRIKRTRGKEPDRKEHADDPLTALEKLICHTMPPIVGPGRWRHLNRR